MFLVVYLDTSVYVLLRAYHQVPINFFPVDSRGEMKEGSVRCRRGELTLWGCSRLDFIDGSRAVLIVIVAVQVLFKQLIVTA